MIRVRFDASSASLHLHITLQRRSIRGWYTAAIVCASLDCVCWGMAHINRDGGQLDVLKCKFTHWNVLENAKRPYTVCLKHVLCFL